MPRIVSVGTALPPHRYAQEAIRDAYAVLDDASGASQRRLSIFDRAGVAARHFCKPLDYYRSPSSFEDRNRAYLASALELGGRALSASLERAACAPSALGHLFAVTTTGLATPSLDARLAHALGLPSSMKRTPIFGTGCASGAVGLSRASEYLRANPEETAAVVSVELCSLTFQRSDRSVRNLVASALFADGAAAVLLAGERAALPGGPRVLATRSHLFADSLDVMGWEFSGSGMSVVLSPEVPQLVLQTFRPLVEGLLRERGLALADIGLWLLHPGGAKVIEAYETALGLTPQETRFTRRFLERHGNLSSASILFILDEVLSGQRPEPGTYGLLAALGPGFAAELLLLRW